jgi:hypothetical protein
MAANLVIVFVPGGLGTQLWLNSTKIWDVDLTSIPPDVSGLRVIIDPSLLLSWLPLQAHDLLSDYNGFITFLNNAGYQTGPPAGPFNLLLFGYDWRQGIEALAGQLATVVNKQVVPQLAGGKKKILFIAHSYGCLVVRWALRYGATPLIANTLVNMVVAAGPPMLGMASSFRDMVHMPSLGDYFDQLFAIVQSLFPSLADPVVASLCKTAMAVTSELEGMPPNQVPILQGGANPPATQPYGVFDWTGWPPQLSTLLAQVKATQAQLLATNWGGINSQIIASSSYDTDTGYVLTPDNLYQSSWPPGPGDGTVLLNSAQAYGGTLHMVASAHRQLLDDPAARAFLSTVI